jgi:hypothetical protein
MRVANSIRVLAVVAFATLLCVRTYIALAADAPLGWSFVNGSAEGYSIQLVSATPPAGTTLAAGQTVEFKVTVSYKLSIADKGTVVLAIQDENNTGLEQGNLQQHSEVARGEGTVSVQRRFEVPVGIHEMRLFVPLVPDGIQHTDGELVLRYPVSNEVKGSTIGYSSVAAALADLHSRPDVQFSQEHGWTIANDASKMTLWSFPPKEDPAYPSAVKRSVIKADKGVNMKMDVLCESTQAACDKLAQDFDALNDRMRNSLKQ